MWPKKFERAARRYCTVTRSGCRIRPSLCHRPDGHPSQRFGAESSKFLLGLTTTWRFSLTHRVTRLMWSIPNLWSKRDHVSFMALCLITLQKSSKMKNKRAFKRLVQLLLQYLGMKGIKELTLSERIEPEILKETWISGASGRIQLLKNRWKFIIQSK